MKEELFLSARYFQAGGSPEHVIQLLSENYSAVAQTVNLLAEWLIQMGRCLRATLLFASLFLLLGSLNKTSSLGQLY